jgi:hypothetical protein
MDTQIIWPKTETISSEATLYVMLDSMPHIDLMNCQNKTHEQQANDLFGANTYSPLFECNNVNLEEKFFIFCTYINFKNFTNKDNVIFLPIWSFYNDASRYGAQMPSIDFDNKHIGISCPMHNQRYNRILASCWLYNNKHQLSLEYTQSWDSFDKEPMLFELLQLGKLATWEGADFEIKNLDKKFIDENFFSFELFIKNKQFRNMLTSSAVSIVLSAPFFEHGCDIDEKYLSALYAGTIPLCDGYEFPDTVKKIGFDVFDDIIDTSYQYEVNPVLRTWSMLEKNKNVLQNGLEYVKRSDIQKRILANYNLAKDPDKFLMTAFTNLNTPTAQKIYLEKFQKQIKEYKSTLLVSDWPVIASL